MAGRSRAARDLRRWNRGKTSGGGGLSAVWFAKTARIAGCDLGLTSTSIRRPATTGVEARAWSCWRHVDGCHGRRPAPGWGTEQQPRVQVARGRSGRFGSTKKPGAKAGARTPSTRSDRQRIRRRPSLWPVGSSRCRPVTLWGIAGGRRRRSEIVWRFSGLGFFHRPLTWGPGGRLRCRRGQTQFHAKNAKQKCDDPPFGDGVWRSGPGKMRENSLLTAPPLAGPSVLRLGSNYAFALEPHLAPSRETWPPVGRTVPRCSGAGAGCRMARTMKKPAQDEILGLNDGADMGHR